MSKYYILSQSYNFYLKQNEKFVSSMYFILKIILK